MALADYSSELMATAQALAAPGKGILAVDESTKTIGKRLGSIGVENTEANRQAYRGMLFTTAGLGEFISGAILYEETLSKATPMASRWSTNWASLESFPASRLIRA